MINKFDFSIIITSKGRRSLFDRSLRSVLKQSIENFQIIIADNNNDIAISNYIKTVLDETPLSSKIDLCYFKSEAKTAGNVRNEAIKIANTDIIFFLDDDDELLLNSLEYRYNYLKTNEDVALIYCAAKSNIENYPFEMYRYYEYSNCIKSNQLNIMSCSCIGIRKSMILSKNISFDKDLIQRHDYDFCKQILKNELKIKSIPLALVRVNIHSQERISSQFSDMQIMRKILLNKWGESIKNELNKYITDVYIWRIYLNKELRSRNKIINELLMVYNIQPSAIFKIKIILIKLAPFLYMFCYHFALFIYQSFWNIKNRF